MNAEKFPKIRPVTLADREMTVAFLTRWAANHAPFSTVPTATAMPC